MNRMMFFAVLVVGFSPAFGTALAQAPSDPKGSVEVGFNRHFLTDGQENWFGGYLRGVWHADRKNTWTGEITGQKQFGDEGTYFAVGNTHVFNENWYSNVTVGTSAGGFYLPRVRIDGFLNRKLLPRKNLVTTAGVGFFDAKSVYYDVSFYGGATYYFRPKWILEGGVRVNVSNPGTVKSSQQFLALTQGENKKYFVTARYGFGREAYQLIAPANPIQNFSSQNGSVTWRQWTGREWGFKVHVERYDNPSYRRTGLEIGIFKDF